MKTKKYKNIGIVGFGREGKSIFDFFKDKTDEFYIFDKDFLLMEDFLKNYKNQNLNIKFFTGPDYKKKLIKESVNLDVIFRSPGVPLWDIEKKINKDKLNSITNYFFKLCKEKKVKIIGITGTKGKGTTSTLIYEILKKDEKDVYLVGNIGNPALDIIDKLNKNSIVVYELSSFQLYDIKYSPDIAICLLITEDHLDWHKNINQYRRSKENIFKFQNKSDVAIFYLDNKYSKEFVNSSKSNKKISYGKKSDADIKIDKDFYYYFNKKIISINEVKLPGGHNQQNIQAAIAATYNLADLKSIYEVLNTFTGLKYHIEKIGEKKGIKFINDSFSVNPTSTKVAIDSFDDNIILILGGIDRGLNLESFIKKIINTKNLKKVILYGDFGKRLDTELTILKFENKVFLSTKNFKKIFNSSLKNAKQGDVILFSPGAPSFDMFENYIKRGEEFDYLFEKWL